MRLLLAAVGAIAAAAPALAAPGDTSRNIVESLPKAGEVDRATQRAEAAADALMDVRIGGMIAALDPDGPGSSARRDDTVGDIMRRDDPAAVDKMRRNIRMLGVGMNALADRLAVLAPEMERSVRDMRRSFRRALRPAPPRDGD